MEFVCKKKKIDRFRKKRVRNNNRLFLVYKQRIDITQCSSSRRIPKWAPPKTSYFYFFFRVPYTYVYLYNIYLRFNSYVPACDLFFIPFPLGLRVRAYNMRDATRLATTYIIPVFGTHHTDDFSECQSSTVFIFYQSFSSTADILQQRTLSELCACIRTRSIYTVHTVYTYIYTNYMYMCLNNTLPHMHVRSRTASAITRHISSPFLCRMFSRLSEA